MHKKKISKSLFVSLTAIVLVGSISVASGAMLAEPGSDEDPIVTLSYVEKRLEQIKYYINQNIEMINTDSVELKTRIDNINAEIQELKASVDDAKSNANNSTTPSAGTSDKYQVVFLEEGKSIYLGESTEIIWRSGKATAIASQNGGLSDMTIGVDLKTGDDIPLNHLIIIPRNDGRGMHVTVSSYVMVKGAYTIK